METSVHCSVNGPCPFQHLTAVEQILAIHLRGRFVKMVKADGASVTICSIAGHTVHIHCRPEADHWIPYLLVYSTDLCSD